MLWLASAAKYKMSRWVPFRTGKVPSTPSHTQAGEEAMEREHGHILAAMGRKRRRKTKKKKEKSKTKNPTQQESGTASAWTCMYLFPPARYRSTRRVPCQAGKVDIHWSVCLAGAKRENAGLLASVACRQGKKRKRKQKNEKKNKKTQKSAQHTFEIQTRTRSEDVG